MTPSPKPYVPQIPPSGPQLVSTRTVRLKATGDEAVINTSDFDAALHADPAPAGDVDTSALKALTVAKLTELAGEKKVELGEATTKADIIAALVAAGITTP